MADLFSFSVSATLKAVHTNIEEACIRSGRETKDVILVAVSKCKSAELVKEAYENGQRDFGENYVKEIIDKAAHPLLRDLMDIRWHFVGHIQSNKCNLLTNLPTLNCVHTVDSENLALQLNKHWSKKHPDRTLKVLIQVNTSGESSKSGILPEDCTVLAKFISRNCPGLSLCGLMTIGNPANKDMQTCNPDFHCLTATKLKLCEDLDINPETVKLSMGMSGDFIHAIEEGSNYIRVGTAIFGSREN